MNARYWDAQKSKKAGVYSIELEQKANAEGVGRQVAVRAAAARVQGILRQIAPSKPTVKLVSEIANPTGIAVRNQQLIVGSKDGCLYNVTLTDPQAPLSILVQSAPKPVDGPLSTAGLTDPRGLCVDGESIFVISTATSQLHLVSATTELAHFIDVNRTYLETAGMMHPSLEQDEEERKRVRDVPLTDSLKVLSSINEGEQEWYTERMEELGLPHSWKSLYGGYGCSNQKTNAGWVRNVTTIQHLLDRLKLIGAQDQAQSLRMHNFNTLMLEHFFGHVTIASSSHDRAQTMKSLCGLLEGMRRESWKSRVDCGFEYVLSRNKLYGGVVTTYDLKEEDLKFTGRARPSRGKEYRKTQRAEAKEAKASGAERTKKKKVQGPWCVSLWLHL